MKHNRRLLAAVVAAGFSASTYAAVSAEEAKQLGGAVLTPWGAEKGGNKDGTIPEWTGERITPPADYDPKEPRRLPNPWKDKPLFTINAQNADKYADKLTESEKHMLKKYPAFRMDVYQSRRTANFPKYVLDNTVKNATACKAKDNGLVLTGCYGGFPFPIPKNGNEAMWNHTARFTLHAWGLVNGNWTVDVNGNAQMQGVTDSHQVAPFYDPKRTGPAADDSLYWMLRWDNLEPARKAGEKYVLLDALDSVNKGRRVFVYVPGQRRVKLSPDLAYDTPSPVSGGSATMDQSQIFNGAQDRFNFKLVGKQEKYIMYNNYELVDYKTCPEAKHFVKNFLNPDCSRWELHRVWVIEANLKPGFRHVMPKRVFYFDEDTMGAGTSDDYDASGKLYRSVMQPYVHLYNLNGYGNLADNTYTYDFQTGMWNVTAVFGRREFGLVEEPPKPPLYFSPEALAGEGVR